MTFVNEQRIAEAHQLSSKSVCGESRSFIIYVVFHCYHLLHRKYICFKINFVKNSLVLRKIITITDIYTLNTIGGKPKRLKQKTKNLLNLSTSMSCKSNEN